MLSDPLQRVIVRIFRSFPYFISLCPRLLQTLLLEAPHRSTPTPAARSAAPINGRDCTKESLRNDLAIAGFQGVGRCETVLRYYFQWQ